MKSNLRRQQFADSNSQYTIDCVDNKRFNLFQYTVNLAFRLVKYHILFTLISLIGF